MQESRRQGLGTRRISFSIRDAQFVTDSREAASLCVIFLVDSEVGCRARRGRVTARAGPNRKGGSSRLGRWAARGLVTVSGFLQRSFCTAVGVEGCTGWILGMEFGARERSAGLSCQMQALASASQVEASDQPQRSRLRPRALHRSRAFGRLLLFGCRLQFLQVRARTLKLDHWQIVVDRTDSLTVRRMRGAQRLKYAQSMDFLICILHARSRRENACTVGYLLRLLPECRPTQMP